MHLVYLPLPGNWVLRAQATLDELSELRSLEEAATRFGDARSLSELVLGPPSVGGSATRRVIRAVGSLLKHRLGPALAAEALSWAASVAEAVDPSTVEDFLESAATSMATYRPVRLDERHPLVSALERLPTPSDRRALLAETWKRRQLEELPRTADGYPVRTLGIEFDDSTLITRMGEAIGADEQLRLYDRATDDDRERLASREELFDMSDELIAKCFRDYPHHIVGNWACPPFLKEALERPRDLDMLELAVRAGLRRSFASGYIKQMLADLDQGSLALLASRIPYELMGALDATGLLTGVHLVDGPLRSVDPHCRAEIARALGLNPISSISAPDWYLDMLDIHPEPTEWLWLMENFSPAAPQVAGRLASNANTRVAVDGIRRLPFELLTHEHSRIAQMAGGAPASSCPGIAAKRRPSSIPIPVPLSLEKTPFSYPAEILALTGPDFIVPPGWSVSLPATPKELKRNARLMRNCTSSYADDVLAGHCVILVLHSSNGRRFNASLHSVETGAGWTVSEINSYRNQGDEPGWIRQSLNEWFRTRAWQVPGDHEHMLSKLRNRQRQDLSECA